MAYLGAVLPPSALCGLLCVALGAEVVAPAERMESPVVIRVAVRVMIRVTP